MGRFRLTPGFYEDERKSRLGDERNNSFSMRLYKANLRNLAIITVAFIVLMVDAVLKWSTLDNDKWIVYVFGVITLGLIAACIITFLYPHLHPFYRQLKKFGDIDEVAEEIDAEFCGTRVMTMQNQFYGKVYYIRKRFIATEVFRMKDFVSKKDKNK